MKIRMNHRFQTCVSALATGLVLAAWPPALRAGEANLYLRCKPDNDLYQVLLENRVPCSRFDTPEQAIREAPEGTGVLVLADDYPKTPTPLNADVFEQAAAKKLRLYVEFPSYLPDTKLGTIAYLKTGEYGAIVSERSSPRMPSVRSCLRCGS